MNKILPIILVVVLSGCSNQSRTSLENCADDKMHWLHFNDDKILNLQPEKFRDIMEKLKANGLRSTTRERLQEARKKREKFLKNLGVWDYFQSASDKFVEDLREEEIRLINLPVNEKLKLSSHYENDYMECEAQRREFPETFDTKWK